MPRHIVCLTFDFDAWSGLIARGLTTPTPISRGEFGVVGTRRILALAATHGLRTSWFIPGTVIQAYPQVCDAIVSGGHEVGHHGWTHDPPAGLSAEQESEGLQRASEAIRRLTGRDPVGYRSPSWDISDRTVDLLLANGFLYESSMMGNDYCPYFVRRGDRIHKDAAPEFGAPTPLVEMPIAWSLDDFPHFEFLRTSNQLMPGLMNARLVLENWIADFEYMQKAVEWGVLTYTFHPYVIGRGHRMLVLEKLVEELARKGAVFLTLEQAALEFQEKAAAGGLSIHP
ncbi:MAG: polysaccharide deacetylase family protein [Pseudomonadota bacterium]